MDIPFTKMHGLGNDYVYINGFETTIDGPADLARAISDRHFGIGGDGLVLILPSESADVRMRMFNADGSEGKMCGNAIRCVAKLAHEQGLARANPLRVETASGIKTINKTIDGDVVLASSVDMGLPILTPADIPVNLPGQKVVGVSHDFEGLVLEITCVSMGNPHVIVFVDDVAAVDLPAVGPQLETAPIFPDRINVHVAQVDGPAELTMRTWERGSGITLACGTGASAVCVAGVLTGRAQRTTRIHLPGGDLDIAWQESDDHVIMTGPAQSVFTGLWHGPAVSQTSN
jgi:diaminopimelate epimerase